MASLYDIIKIQENKSSKIGYASDYNFVTRMMAENQKKKAKREDYLKAIGKESHLEIDNYFYADANKLNDGLSDVMVNGFIEDDSLKQAVCVVIPYMSFPLWIEGHKKYYNVGKKTENSENRGETLVGPFTTIPTIATVEKIDRMSSIVDSPLFGVGLDLKKFGEKYFAHFYGGTEWKYPNYGKLKELAEKRLLMAEITLLVSGKGEILKAPVIVDRRDAKEDESFINIPVIIFLLEKYEKMADVHFKLLDGTTMTIVANEKKPTCGLINKEGAKYNSKSGEISQINSALIKTTVSPEGGTNLELVRLDWRNNGNAKDLAVRIRLYFDGEREEDVTNIIGEIPSFCRDILGPLNKIDVDKIEDKTNEINKYTSGEIYIEEQYLPTGITRPMYEKAIRLLWLYETGRNETSAIASKRDKTGYLTVVQGESWYSYGNFQNTERPGDRQITNLLNLYEKICKDSGEPYDKKAMATARTIPSKETTTDPVLRTAFETISDNRMFKAQTMRFAKGNYVGESEGTLKFNSSDSKARVAKKLYDKIGLNSLMGYFMCIQFANNGVYISDYTSLANYGSEKEKLLKVLKTRKNTLKNHWSGWINMWNDWERIIKTGDVNLESKHTWKDGVVI